MLENIMWPGIKLMDRLGYAAKFGLISGLFLVPLLFLSGEIFLTSWQSINKTQQEKNAVFDVRLMDEYIISLEQARDIAAPAAHLSDIDLKNKANEVLVALSAKTQTLLDSIDDKQLQQALMTWQQEFSVRFSMTGEHRMTRFLDQYNYYQRSINEFQLVLQEFCQRKGISLDSNSDIQGLNIIINNKIPEIKESFGFANSIALYSFAENYLQSGTYDILNSAYDRLIATETKINLMKKDAELLNNPALMALIDDSLVFYNDMIDILDNDIIGASSIEKTWQQHYEYYGEQQALFDRINNVAIDGIYQILEQRLNEQTKNITILVIALASVVLVITYLYLSFFISVRKSIKHFSSTAAVIANGDLTKQIVISSHDEMGQLRDSFNQMISNIAQTLTAVQQSSMAVTEKFNEVETIANLSQKTAKSQLEQTNQISTVISEVAQGSADVSQLAIEAESAAKSGQLQSSQAGDVVSSIMAEIRQLSVEMQNSMEAVNRLASNSTSISNILGTINGIAEQTNLLALNAAIEAARAGEQGRGFAVVADEVRTLASRTQASAGEIEELIRDVQVNIVKAVDTMQTNRDMADSTANNSTKVGETLDQIKVSMADIQSKTTLIVSHASEQKMSAENLQNNLELIRDSGQQSSENAKGTVDAVAKTQEIITTLNSKISQFKVS
ncbi:MAG: methyl-accepting chemotaxis protein [Oleibacter sp.]|nr:methyl-accepting chemotaxis protein [Thalassolituus sp.]